MRANEFIIESLDKPYSIKWEKTEFGDYDALVKLPDGTNLSMMFNDIGSGAWDIGFYRNNSLEVTGEGDAQRIFATVLAAIQKFIKKHKPNAIKFSASKEVEPGQNSESRTKLYNRLVQRYASGMGYNVEKVEYPEDTMYKLIRNEETIKEDSTGKQTTLDELYKGQYPDRDETFWDYVSTSELKLPLKIHTMPKHKVMIMILSQYRAEHIDEVYDMLDEEQQEIVQHYMNDSNLSNTVVVISEHRIIDGNHRALAAAMKGVSINYVDLSELDNIEVDEDISRRGFLGGLVGAALGATGAQAKMHPSATPALKAQPVANNPKVELLLKWAKQFIKDPAELAAFMAQCAHESDNFKTMNEYGTPERFAHKYDIQFNPKKAKELGNDKPGDGIKYRGRGYIQLTGKYNYEKAGEWISKFLDHPVDFVSNPNMVATPTAAALSSIWYWLTFVRPRTKSFSNTKQVTKHINTGLKGQANREQKAKDWQTALHVKPIKPGQGIKVASR